ncbi:MarR family winged helix-turn-helix transcriptional regulator [Roseomonas sp. CCTCC AB2023176]|uniref:MarR family winged helix-turn-helix transcriptional regulator n=1 Tax=Roseomonas sp. CCTCC AB2023176 TaxID=3342640 RepID=UPI0035D73102
MSTTESLPLAASQRVYRSCLCLHSQRAARAIGRRFDNAFRPLDLTNGQFSLLHSLNRSEVATVSRLAALLAMDRTTVTAALKPLERRGLLESRPNPEDARSRHLFLTPDGHALLAQAMPIWERTLAELEATLPDADRLRSELRGLA